MTKLPGIWSLTSEAAKEGWHHKRTLVRVLGWVALPLAVLYFFLGDSDATLSAYTAFATIFMNVALIWVILRLREGKVVTAKQAYYEGTTATVRFLLFTAILLGMALPFLLGATIFFNGAVGEGAVTSVSEQVLLGAVWLLLALPTLYWLPRAVFGVFELDGGAGPIEAARASRRLVQGHNLAVAGRLAGLLMVLIITVTLPSYVVLTSFQGSTLALTLAAVQLIGTVVVLPWMYLYLHRVYESLIKASK